MFGFIKSWSIRVPFCRCSLVLILGMDKSPNLASSWPSDEGQAEPSTSIKARTLAKAIYLALAPVASLESEGPYQGDFSPGQIQSKLLKGILYLYHCG